MHKSEHAQRGPRPPSRSSSRCFRPSIRRWSRPCPAVLSRKKD